MKRIIKVLWKEEKKAEVMISRFRNKKPIFQVEVMIKEKLPNLTECRNCPFHPPSEMCGETICFKIRDVGN